MVYVQTISSTIDLAFVSQMGKIFLRGAASPSLKRFDHLGRVAAVVDIAFSTCSRSRAIEQHLQDFTDLLCGLLFGYRLEV